MALIQITPAVWVDSLQVAAIDSKTEIQGDQQSRTTTFRSASGAVLVKLEASAGFSTHIDDSNVELKIMHALQDEAIAAVREHRDALHSSKVSGRVLASMQSS